MVNPRGYATSFSYDAAGRKLTETDPLGRVTTFGYDGVGNRTLRVNARSQAVTYTYSGNRELIGERYPGGRVHTYTYDGDGNRTRIADATGITTLVYDSRDLLEETTSPDGQTVTYSYSGTRQRRGMIDPAGGRTTYTYDSADRLVGIVNPQGKRTTLSYDAKGRRVRIEHGNGALTTHVYDCADRVTRIEHRKSGGTLVNLTTYTYDNVGNRTGAAESSGDVTTWTYDATYQLTHEVRSGSHSFDVTYTYDASGNRLTQVDSGAVTTSTYDGANQLLTSEDAFGSTSYCYDADGNRTCKDAPRETIYYEWDEDSRLTLAEPPSGKTTFTCRGDGRRVRKETPTATSKFIYDGHRLLEETDGDDELERQYTSTLAQWGELLSEYDGTDTDDHLCDALGSTDALLDESQTATDRYQYRSFGVQTQQGSHASPFTFVGAQSYYRDSDLDLYYAGARYYDPVAGRWLSEDPVGFAAGDVNLYRYVRNNPVNKIDPSGLQDWTRQNTTTCHQPQSTGDGNHVFRLSLLSESKLSPEEEELDRMLRELQQRVNRLLRGEKIDDSLIQSMQADGQLRIVDNGKVLQMLHAVMPLPDGKQLVLSNCFTIPWLPGQELEEYWTVYDIYPASTVISFDLIANHKVISHGLRRAHDMIAAIHAIPFGVVVDYAYSGEGNPLDVTLLTIGDCFLVSGMAMRAAGETGRIATAVALGDTAFEATVGTKRLIDAYEFAAEGQDFEARLASAEALLRIVGVSFAARDLLRTARQAYTT